MPGVLWTTAGIQNERKDLPRSLLDAWYDEHINICLSCPGNGGLFLRYRNVDPASSEYVRPKFNEGTTSEPFVPTTWPFLALVKLDDTKWLSSQQFNDMPRVSKLLPLEADGSIGSAFSCWYGALRGYETISTVADPTGQTTRPKYILSVQLKQAYSENSKALEAKYARQPGFRGAIKYRLREDLLLVQEPGVLPKSLVLFEFDGEGPPRAIADDSAFKVDAWELLLEAGDTSLRL